MSRPLAEVIKLSATSGRKFKEGVVEAWEADSPLFREFQGITVPVTEAMTYSYNREVSLAGGQWRDINDDFTYADSTTELVHSALKILGGKAKVDIVINEQLGMKEFVFQKQGQIKSVILDWGEAIIKGDTDLKQFAGFANLVGEDYTIDNDTTACGLHMAKIRQAKRLCYKPTHIFASGTTIDIINKYAESSNINYITKQYDQNLGLEVAYVLGLKVVDTGVNSAFQSIQDFDQSFDDSTETSDLYIGSLTPDGLVGLVGSKGLSVFAKDQMEAEEKALVKVHMVCGLAMLNARSLVRVKGFTAEDMTA